MQNWGRRWSFRCVAKNQRVWAPSNCMKPKTVYSVQSTARWARGLRNCFRRRSSPGNMSGKSDAHPVRDQTALHAQVNPHFCLMRLTPLKAVIRRDSETGQPAGAVSFHFFRKTLKRPSEFVTLADEIEHVNAYLQIEKARFQSRLWRSTLLFRKNYPSSNCPRLPCNR